MKYYRAAGTSNSSAAQRLQHEFEFRREQLKLGFGAVPEGVTVKDYLLWGREAPDDSPQAINHISITALVAAYEKSLNKESIAESTRKTKIMYVRHFERFLEKNKNAVPAEAAAWRKKHVEAYMSWRLSRKGKSPGYKLPRTSVVMREVRAIGWFFDYGRGEEWFQIDPTAGIKPMQDNAPEQIWRTTPEVLERLKEASLSEEERANTLKYWYYTAKEVGEIIDLFWARSSEMYVERKGDVAMFMELCARGGIRRGEVAKTKVSDVSCNPEGDGWVIARSKKQKRDVLETIRHVPLPQSTMKRLLAWKDSCRGKWLFGKSEEDKGYLEKIYRHIDKISAGSPFIHLRPHQLRHSAETNWQEEGVSQRVIDAVLGHTKGNDISQRYTHIRKTHILEEFRAKVWGKKA